MRSSRSTTPNLPSKPKSASGPGSRMSSPRVWISGGAGCKRGIRRRRARGDGRLEPRRGLDGGGPNAMIVGIPNGGPMVNHNLPLKLPVLPLVLAALGLPAALLRAADDPWVVFEGKEGLGKGKHVVLVSGDEEYRSEESLPQLAKILAVHHGFRCTVLFAIDRKDGTINPNQGDNIPGLEALQMADLMVIFTRFRDLPDEQMKHIVDYVDSGKPVIGLRTATHAFDIGPGKTYARYSWKSREWPDGFGRQVLGETWISHHG